MAPDSTSHDLTRPHTRRSTRLVTYLNREAPGLPAVRAVCRSGVGGDWWVAG